MINRKKPKVSFINAEFNHARLQEANLQHDGFHQVNLHGVEIDAERDDLTIASLKLLVEFTFHTNSEVNADTGALIAAVYINNRSYVDQFIIKYNKHADFLGLINLAAHFARHDGHADLADYLFKMIELEQCLRQTAPVNKLQIQKYSLFSTLPFTDDLKNKAELYYKRIIAQAKKFEKELAEDIRLHEHSKYNEKITYYVYEDKRTAAILAIMFNQLSPRLLPATMTVNFAYNNFVK